MAPHLDAVTHYACDSLKFDPNYNDVDVEEDDVDMDDADDSEVFDDEYVDDSGFAEDDDSSWKVRRMSARLLAHIVQLNGVAPDTLRFAAQNLVNRLREREESVLMDILYALVALVGLHGTQPVSMPAIEMATVPGAKPRKGATVPSPRLIGAQVELLRAIVSAASSASLPGYIAASRAALDPAIAPSSRVVAVELLSVACRSHQASAFSGQCGMITDIASRACEDRYYRLVAAGVTLAGDIAVCVAQLPSEMATVTPRIAALVSKSLDANDVDREIKEAAICAAATVLAYLHPTLETAVGQRLLSAVLDRVRNESTRLAAVRAIKVIASSTSPYAKQVAADFIASELVPLLRKSSRILVEASLEALIALAQAGLLSSLDGTALVPLLDSEPNALNLLRVFFERSPTAARSTVEPLVDALVELPVARGFRNVDALVSVLKLLPSPQALVPRFLQCVSTMSQQHGKLGKTTLQCTARVVGMLGADAQAFHSLVLSDCSEDMRVFGLLVLGYLRDASSVAIMKDMYTATQRYSEDIRAAAAAALGNILDTESVLRLVTQAVASNSASDVYMALQSLREHLVVHHVKLDAGSRARAVGVLEPLARAESEAVRSVVADCLARIGDLSLLLRITSDYLQQATALTALRIMISSQDGIASLEDLRRAVEALIPLGRRPSTPSVDSAPVRRAALLLVQTLAHQRPVLLKASPAAAAVATEIARAETVRDESLVRTVQLGPQKHEQDDGLELRKTALETILNLRDTNVLACDDAEFVSTLAQSIGSDKSMDVRGLAARILLKTMKAVSATLQNRTQVLTDLSLALKSMLALKVKQDALDQERERHDATLSLGLRIIVGVEHYVKGAEGNQQFKALLTESVTDDLAVRYKKIAQEEETEQR
jgi:cullin-associated NEDD8-dissociated protein 1